MSPTRIALHPFVLPLSRPLVTAQHVVHQRSGVIVAIHTPDGRRGLGECSPLAGFSSDDLATVIDTLECLDAASLPITAETPAAVQAWLDELHLTPASAHGLASALVDLAAQRRECTAARWLSSSAADHASTAVLVATPDDVRAALAEGCSVIKVKVGNADLDRDDARLAAIRAAVGPDVAIRIDANGAWTEVQAAKAIDQLRIHTLECIEEPVRDRDLDAMHRLRSRGVAIAADESLRSPTDLARIIATKAADIAVIKPMLVGGPIRALEMVSTAHDAGLDAYLTTTIDSVIGRCCAIHTAAAAPGLLPSGLATGRWLARDLAIAEAVTDGRIHVGRAPGLGFNDLDLSDIGCP